jgi:hypothetical protein
VSIRSSLYSLSFTMEKLQQDQIKSVEKRRKKVQNERENQGNKAKD